MAQVWTRLRPWRALGEALCYLAPSLLLFAVFVFYPLARSAQLSVFQTDLLGAPRFFTGWRQYQVLFTTAGFGRSVWLTFLFAVYTVIPSLVLSLALAYMAHWRLRGMAVFRTLFALPLVIAVASASLMFMMLYNPSAGVLNYFLAQMHLPPVNWLADPRWALLSVVAVAVWRSLGFNVIVLLGGLQSIPAHLYESACIDGAGRWRLFWDITMPLLSPTLFFVFIVNTISALQTFGEINILAQGGPAGATNVMVYAIYREAFFNFNFSLASAAAVVLFVLIMLLTLLQFTLLEKKVFYQ